MRFVANISLIFFFCVFVLFLTGCSSMQDKRSHIIEQLQDAGCSIHTYNERFEKSISIKCLNALVGDVL